MRFLLGVRKLCSVFNKMSAAPPPDYSQYTSKDACEGVDGGGGKWTPDVLDDAGNVITPGSCAAPTTGGRHRGVKAKTLRRMLKKAGLKTSGKKSTLTKRCKKAHLMRGGLLPSSPGAGGPAGYPFDAGMVQRGGAYGAVSSFASMEEPAGVRGGRRRGVKAKTLKKLLKKAGLKVSGKKSTLRARAKKAHLVRGGLVPSSGSPEESQFTPMGRPWGDGSA